MPRSKKKQTKKTKLVNVELHKQGNRNTGSANKAATDEISMDTAFALFLWALYQMYM